MKIRTIKILNHIFLMFINATFTLQSPFKNSDNLMITNRSAECAVDEIRN